MLENYRNFTKIWKLGLGPRLRQNIRGEKKTVLTYLMCIHQYNKNGMSSGS